MSILQNKKDKKSEEVRLRNRQARIKTIIERDREEFFLESQKEFSAESGFDCADCYYYSSFRDECRLNDTQEFCKVIRERDAEREFLKTHESIGIDDVGMPIWRWKKDGL